MSDNYDQKELATYNEFIKSAEFKRLTEGEDARFPNFDTENAEHLRKMRDHINLQVPGVWQKKYPNLVSVKLSKVQIGRALEVRKEYEAHVKQFEKDNPTRAGHSQVTVNRHRRLGRAPDVSRRIRC